MSPLRVLVHGAVGRMGAETVRAVAAEGDMVVVGGVDLDDSGGPLVLPNGGTAPLFADIAKALEATRPDVVMDFTNLDAAMACARASIRARTHVVCGSSGFGEAQYQELDRLAREAGTGVLVVPNFALGAVVLAYLVRKAAPFFDYVEIVETHHEKKIDSPSGNARDLARIIVGAAKHPLQRNTPEKESPAGARGAEIGDVGIHSLRMPGRLAHHEVIFGAPGQTLSLRHDTITRECYMPGVLRAIREVVHLRGLTVGLEALLGLTD